MRTTENFLKSLPIVASQLGNKLGVKVNLGNSACTDGEVITLPLSVDERSTSREELLGFLVHEASHIRHTSMAATAMLRSFPPIAFELTNAVEDARIEQLITAEYAGASYLLNEAHKPCYEKVLAPDFNTNPQTAFVLYPLYACEATYNAAITPCRDVFRQQCVNHFGEEIMTQVDQELKVYPTLTTTYDVVEVALRLMAILTAALPPDNQPQSDESQEPDQQQSQQSSSAAESQDCSPQEGTSQKNSAKAQSNDDVSGSKQKSDESNQGSPNNSNSETDKQSESSSENSGQDSDQTSDQNQANGSSSSSASKEEKTKERKAKRIGKAIARALGPKMKIDQSLNPGEALKAKLNNDASDKEASEDSRVTNTFEAKAPATCSELLKGCKVSKSIPLLGEQRLQIAKKQSVKARKALSSMVQAKARTGFYIANSGHRVSARCLHRLNAGNTRIFEKRDEVVGINTSVSLLLDLSGSVCGDEETVISAGLAMIEALRGIQGVKAQMGVFPACANQYLFNEKKEAGALNVVVPFGEDPRKYLKEIGSLTAFGGTPLANALVQNVIQLTSRPENRHIIIVVTDGYVSCDAELIIKKLLKSGITVVGIGVGGVSSDSFDSLFPIWEVLPFDGLPEALMKISRRLMLEGFQAR